MIQRILGLFFGVFLISACGSFTVNVKSAEDAARLAEVKTDTGKTVMVFNKGTGEAWYPHGAAVAAETILGMYMAQGAQMQQLAAKLAPPPGATPPKVELKDVKKSESKKAAPKGKEKPEEKKAEEKKPTIDGEVKVPPKEELKPGTTGVQPTESAATPAAPK